MTTPAFSSRIATVDTFHATAPQQDALGREHMEGRALASPLAQDRLVQIRALLILQSQPTTLSLVYSSYRSFPLYSPRHVLPLDYPSYRHDDLRQHCTDCVTAGTGRLCIARSEST